VKRFGPEPKSKSGPGLVGQLLGGGPPRMQPTFQSSNPCTPVAHLIAPVDEGAENATDVARIVAPSR
jgi:hypothetical protein